MDTFLSEGSSALNARDATVRVSGPLSSNLIVLLSARDNQGRGLLEGNLFLSLRRMYPNILRSEFDELMVEEYSGAVTHTGSRCVLAAFSHTSTLHAFVRAFEIMADLELHPEDVAEATFLMTPGVCPAIHEIMGRFFTRHNVDLQRIVWLNPGVTYKSDAIRLIPFTHFYLDYEDTRWRRTVDHLVSEYGPNGGDTGSHGKPSGTVAIIRSTTSESGTDAAHEFGTPTIDDVNVFCARHRVVPYTPGHECTEADVIDAVSSCSTFIASFGTAHLKNLAYISDLCTHVYVLVPPTERYRKEYASGAKGKTCHAPLRVKGASVSYILYDGSLRDVSIDDLNPQDDVIG